MEERSEREALEQERWEILGQIEDWLEGPMLLLGLVWLLLLIVELIWGLTPLLESLTTAIWALFILDFALRLALAPDRSDFLKQNVLTLVSLLLPALRLVSAVRFLRVFQAARAARGLRLVKVLGSVNRGMRALGGTMSRRGFRYVLALTGLVLFVGAAGIYAFESEREAGRAALPNLGAALWWTAMLMTTIGSEYWPQTGEGRILTFLLSVYSMGVLGYLTAALASFFVGRDAVSDEAEVAGTGDIEALRLEIVALREEIRALRPPGGG